MGDYIRIVLVSTMRLLNMEKIEEVRYVNDAVLNEIIKNGTEEEEVIKIFLRNFQRSENIFL